MSRFAKVQPVTAWVGGNEHTFRSLLEYRYAVFLEFMKGCSAIKDWWYEDQDSRLDLYYSDRKSIWYLPDFTVQTNTGDYEFHETKGHLSQKDYGKIKRAAQQYDNDIVLIFANEPKTTRNAKTLAKWRMIEKLEPYLKRVIWRADKELFEPIKFMMEF